MAKIVVDKELLIEKHNKEIDEKRKIAYANESDPLFFKAQRGAIPMSVWEDKIEEIKKRYPRK